MFGFVVLRASKADRHMVVLTLKEKVWMLEPLRPPQHK